MRQKKLSRNQLFIKQFLGETKVSLCDVGGRGGIEPRWADYHQHLDVTFFEPDKRSRDFLINIGHKTVDKGVWSCNDNRTLFLTSSPGCTSLFKPRQQYLDLFPDPKRFEIVDEVEIETTTLDEVFVAPHSYDFLKLDIQGAELEAIKGGQESLKTALGIELEIEFKSIYQNQPLFGDVKKSLENSGFHFIDFTNICRWERTAHDGLGESVFGDAIFLRYPEEIVCQYNADLLAMDTLKSYAFILFLYKRHDLLLALDDLVPNKIKSQFNLSALLKELASQRQSLIRTGRLFNTLTSAMTPGSRAHIIY
ncbi:FkbM family methyltransferase [Kiloniella laminariae]|uniref:FkbM family methyltransferase n=1 Tax=Kiloniella laminariae TaxID=454162 RepID=UPI00036165FD|nr:FkbM family methyltransferase [Kiloniella laminariae]